MEKDEPERVCWISGGRRPTPTGFRRVEFSSATVTVSVFRIFFCHNFLAVSLGSVLNFDTPVQFNIGSVQQFGSVFGFFPPLTLNQFISICTFGPLCLAP